MGGLFERGVGGCVWNMLPSGGLRLLESGLVRLWYNTRSGTRGRCT